MKKSILPIIMMAVFTVDAFAAVKVKNATAMRYEEQMGIENAESGEISRDEAADIATLENDIRILDEEIAKCKKQKKGWIAATVIGAAGTVATGVAAGVQAVKLKETKDQYGEQKIELEGLRDTLHQKEVELENLK